MPRGREGEPRRNGWEGLSEWYDENQGERRDLWHRNLVDLDLLEQQGDLDGVGFQEVPLHLVIEAVKL